MCEFCTKHGDGKKWYLQAKNYSEELERDLHRRKIEQKWFRYFDEGLGPDLRRMENDLPRVPAPIRRLASAFMTARHKREHFGQVVPIEDIERIFGMVSSIVRVPCVCRRVTVGREVAYCFGLSTQPPSDFRDPSYQSGPDTAGFERMTSDEALEFMKGLEKEGVMHSIWTFGTPYIGGLCNCDRHDCVAMRSTVNHGVKVMFKAEYVAAIDLDLCTGCRSCMRFCQFGAMGFSTSDRKAFIDIHKCFGCGVCRAGCTQNAIKLRQRTAVPLLAKNW